MSFDKVVEITLVRRGENVYVVSLTFACLLRKAGVDTMTIKDLGRWESLEMGQRHTRSVSFHDSLKFYKVSLP